MKYFSIIFSLLYLSFPLKSFATDFASHGPISLRPQNPIYLQFIGSPLEKATTLKKNGVSLNTEVSYSNLFENDPRTTGTGLTLDMELIRTAFEARYGVTNAYEVGIELPFISTTGGVLDGFIQDYHNAFGFPNSGRNTVSNGSYDYHITSNGNTLYRVTSNNTGFGDITIFNKLQIFEESKTIPAISAKLALKLPTGSPAEGTGSGYTDVAFNLIAEKNFGRFHSYSLVGLGVLGGHRYLDPIMKKGGVFFGQALEVNLHSKRVSAVVQLVGNTPFLGDTGSSKLDQIAIDFTVGVVGDIPLKGKLKKLNYQVGFAEDPVKEGPSVDFTVFFKMGFEI